MKCPGCGYESFEHLETCKHCGAQMAATALAPGSPIDCDAALLGLRLEPERSDPEQGPSGHGRRRAAPGNRVDRGGDFIEMLDDDAIEIRDDDLDAVLAAAPVSPEDDAGPPFRIDDDLFMGREPGAPEVPGSADWTDHGGSRPAAGVDLPWPPFALSGNAPDGEAAGEPIIDRDDEVPERYWAPEIAGLGRRALGLLLDQLVLTLVLGVFVLGAFLALRLNGFDTDLFLAAAGFQASALPFALLAAVLNLVYYSYFHGSTGRTPGKVLVGVEVRTGAGGQLSWGRALLRWGGAALGLACAGVGIFWAIFEPRHRGWADLISGTVVARPRREPAAGAH